jgi:hypothetical protein
MHLCNVQDFTLLTRKKRVICCEDKQDRIRVPHVAEVKVQKKEKKKQTLTS